MFDLLVFTQHPSSYAPNRFIEECKKLKIKAKIIDYADINYPLPDSKNIIFREPDFVKNIYGKRDELISYYLNKGAYVLNSNTYLTWSVLDKKTQHDIFEKDNIPCIKPIKFEDAEYPYVVKAKLGSHGSHVFKIENKENLKIVLEKYKKEDLLVQEFQKSGFDLRVIVLGDKVLGIMQRNPKEGSFLSNYSQGGTVINYEGEDRNGLEEIALRTANAFYLDYCGVDIMKGNDGNWKVLEVNRACQFKGFEKATEVNVAREIIDFLLKSKKSVV